MKDAELEFLRRRTRKIELFGILLLCLSLRAESTCLSARFHPLLEKTILTYSRLSIPESSELVGPSVSGVPLDETMTAQSKEPEYYREEEKKESVFAQNEVSQVR